MKYFNNNRSLLFTLFILLLGLLVNNMVYLKIKDMSSQVGYNKVIIQLKADAQLDKGFSSNIKRELEELIASGRITYYKLDKTSIAYEDAACEALAYGITGDYKEFHNVRLKAGAFVNEQDDVEKNYVVVMEDRLAKAIFKSDDVVGLNISLYGKKFRIIGVTSYDKSLLGRLTDNKPPDIYLPLSVLSELKTDHYITNIEYETPYSSYSRLIARDILNYAKADINNFEIIDYNELGVLISQRTKIIIFVLCFFCICRLEINIYEIMVNMLKGIKEQLKENYFLEAVKKYKNDLLFNLLKAIIAFLLIVILWKLARFNLYIAPDKIPSDPTSASEIMDILGTSIKSFFAEDISGMMKDQKQVELLYKLSGIAFIAGIIAELLTILWLFKCHKNSEAGVIEAVTRLTTGFYLKINGKQQ